MKLSIIIPVFNEIKTIEEILRRVEEVDFSPFEKEIVIVDDFSSDGTRELLKRYENDHHIHYHDQNRGKGMALRSALRFVSGDVIVVQDADLEYNPWDLKKMLDKMVQEDISVVYGSRRLSRSYAKYKRSGHIYAFGGIFLTWLTNILYNTSLTDEPTCYKMFRADLLKNIDLQCRRFEFCPEVTAKIVKKGIKIHEVPIEYCPRHKNEGKKIKFVDGIQGIWTLLKHRF